MKSTVENNKLIAGFANYPTKMLAGKITDSLAGKLYKDWNSLMTIVEKIESMDENNSVIISENVCTIFAFTEYLENSHGETKVEAVYSAITQFIEWYNVKNPT